jgi:hypothetical protein
MYTTCGRGSSDHGLLLALRPAWTEGAQVRKREGETEREIRREREREGVRARERETASKTQQSKMGRVSDKKHKTHRQIDGQTRPDQTRPDQTRPDPDQTQTRPD